ncbi:hypothetical protein ACQPVP_02500 [Clostridium nigeriense]|uniref:hypothetical protein n=1 Tax=Clostridium nigeriense TaxID=1805470 RepID=UPI003D3336B9
MVRLTRDVRQRILEQNEGFSTRTYYEGRNTREERIVSQKKILTLLNEVGKITQKKLTKKLGVKSAFSSEINKLYIFF